jgi:hypothetical protein
MLTKPSPQTITKMTDALINAGKDRHVMLTRVLRWQTVLLHVRFRICVCCSILILLTKTVSS